MKPEERMTPLGGHNHYGPFATRPVLHVPRIKSRNCGDIAGANRKRWLGHQKKLALAIVRLCVAGASLRNMDRGLIQ
jgi:hypothetical protein